MKVTKNMKVVQKQTKELVTVNEISESNCQGTIIEIKRASGETQDVNGVFFPYQYEAYGFKNAFSVWIAKIKKKIA